MYVETRSLTYYAIGQVYRINARLSFPRHYAGTDYEAMPREWFCRIRGNGDPAVGSKGYYWGLTSRGLSELEPRLHDLHINYISGRFNEETWVRRYRHIAEDVANLEVRRQRLIQQYERELEQLRNLQL